MRTFALVCFIFLLAAVLRLAHIQSIPWAVHFDEADSLGTINAMLAGDCTGFQRVINGNTGSQVLLEWAWRRIGVGAFLANRISAATFGVLLVGVTMWLGRIVTRSPLTGILAGALLAVDPWTLLTTRQWQPLSAAPVGAALALAMVVAVVNADSPRRECMHGIREPFHFMSAALAGILIGVALTFYDPVKIVLVIAPAYWLWRACTTPGFARRTLLRALTMAIAATVTLLIVLGPVGRASYLNRFWHTTSLAGSSMEGSARPWTDVAHLVVGGARLAADRPLDLPLLSPILVALSLLGAFVAPERSLLLIWIAATAVAVAVSNIPDAAYRLFVMIPAVAVLSAAGLRALWKANRAAAALVTCLHLVWSGIVVDRYIVRGRASEGQELGRFIAEGPDVRYFVAAADHWTGNKTFRALVHERTLVDKPGEADIVVIPAWAFALQDAHPWRLVDPAGRLLGWWREREYLTAGDEDDEASRTCP